jgi:hypothetical protein
MSVNCGNTSCVTTEVSRLVCLGIKHPWGLRSDFYYCQTFAVLLMWGALSDETTGLSFTIAAVLASVVIFGFLSRGTRDHILLSQIRDLPFCRLLRLAGLQWRYSTCESESETLYDWRFTANQFILAPSPLRLTARIFIFNWALAVIVLM